ncbi:thiosulfate:glutathione sulfurtransferase [Salarias fasciatus]|uniref:Thiosulfate:glutathione sulfurtransferase-like n=1 Tax=Salarias fasciatus TaxID=181472 RepID=A0A672GSF6_SALFA|nr:thiosulfate:glutathione sulfurtransferase-like [Salarias fasciatus]
MVELFARRLRAAFLFTMFSFLLSRGCCQLVTAANRSFPSTLAPDFRAFTTTCPIYGELSENASQVSYPELKTMLSSSNIQLFDVRTPDEFQAGRIAEAVNIPLDTLEESLKLSPELFQKKFEVKPPGKDDNNTVFYCRSGNRSAKALAIAYQLGFSKVRHYKGGYTEWIEKEGK